MSNRCRPARIALGIAATAVGLILIAHSVDLGAAGRVLASARPSWLAVAGALTGVSVVATVAQSGVILRSRSAVAWRRLGAAYARSLFVGHVVPGGFGGDASITLELGADHGHDDVIAAGTPARRPRPRRRSRFSSIFSSCLSRSAAL